ncbi:MAG: GTP-binding protein [Candidatus Helarchaeota archaeon]|nr:GTP-binding protein [Candidatus Helarchaeota archaeon]
MKPAFRFKLILFGNIAVGKTSIIDRYVNNKFENEYISTMGYNVFEKTIDINGNSVSFMIFDIGGQEKFEELRKKYAEGANVALLVYDITNRESFTNIKKWHQDLINFTDNAFFILIGNKVDLEEARQVQMNEGADLAKEIQASGFFETSAKTNVEINNAFYKLAQMLLEKALY